MDMFISLIVIIILQCISISNIMLYTWNTCNFCQSYFSKAGKIKWNTKQNKKRAPHSLDEAITPGEFTEERGPTYLSTGERECVHMRVYARFPAFVWTYFLSKQSVLSQSGSCHSCPFEPQLSHKEGELDWWSLRSLFRPNTSGFYVDTHFCAHRRMPNGCILCILSSVALHELHKHSRLLCGDKHPGQPCLLSHSCSEEMLYIPPQDCVKRASMGWFYVRIQW